MGCGMDVGLLGDRMSAHEHSARRCMQEALCLLHCSDGGSKERLGALCDLHIWKREFRSAAAL